MTLAAAAARCNRPEWRGAACPRVVISGQTTRRFTCGVTEEANSFRCLILDLDCLFQGFGHQVDEGMAVAIDGEQIYPNLKVRR